MASNFFEQQDVARKKTGYLVALFAAAVVAIVFMVYALVLAVLIFNADRSGQMQNQGATTPPPMSFYLGAFALTAVVVTLVIGACSVYKISSLRSGGGESVARMMGGRLLHPDTVEADERKILNVVEEMALASGTPVPPVYLMEHERGINALAAGYAPESAVIGITRGAIEQLSRDELQGVVAHEFSHILNGDMRLNIRLMGVIFGIIAIAVVGRVLLRAALYSGGGRSRKDGRAVAGMIGVGLALLIIGGVGVLFGRLIQAAVSRQREFLADASAVQFTRNPDTIGGALKRIGGYGSGIQDGHAEEVGHMFIASAASSWGIGALATHPPLEERIKRIDPSWTGEYPEPRKTKTTTKKQAPGGGARSPFPMAGEAGHVLGGLPGAILGGAVLGEAAGQPRQQRQPGRAGASPPTDSAVDLVGTVSPAHVERMRELLAGIPDALKSAAREPFGARAVVYALLMDSDAEVRDKQRRYLAEHTDQAVNKLVDQVTPGADALAKAARLPLIDLAVPALREMSDKQYAGFKQSIDALIEADGRVDLFEWTLRRLLVRHLDAHFHPAPDPVVQYYNLKPMAQPCAVLLSALSHVGHKDADDAQQAFAAGAGELGVAGLTMLDRKQIRLEEVGQSLDQLIHTSLREKKKLIRACARAIAADGEVTRGEGELMRAVADSLGVPMPPLLPGQKLV